MQGTCKRPPPLSSPHHPSSPPPGERQSDGSTLTKVEPQCLQYQRRACTPKGAGSLKSSAPPAAAAAAAVWNSLSKGSDASTIRRFQHGQSASFFAFREQKKKKERSWSYLVVRPSAEHHHLNLTAKWGAGQGQKSKNPKVVHSLNVLNELTSNDADVICSSRRDQTSVAALQSVWKETILFVIQESSCRRDPHVLLCLFSLNPKPLKQFCKCIFGRIKRDLFLFFPPGTMKFDSAGTGRCFLPGCPEDPHHFQIFISNVPDSGGAALASQTILEKNQQKTSPQMVRFNLLFAASRRNHFPRFSFTDA